MAASTIARKKRPGPPFKGLDKIRLALAHAIKKKYPGTGITTAIKQACIVEPDGLPEKLEAALKKVPKQFGSKLKLKKMLLLELRDALREQTNRLYKSWKVHGWKFEQEILTIDLSDYPLEVEPEMECDGP